MTRRLSKTLPLLMVLLFHTSLMAQEWQRQELGDSHIFVSMPKGAKQIQGTLRSMPAEMRWTGVETPQPTSATNYLVAIAKLPEGLSLKKLAQQYIRIESDNQENIFKKNKDPLLRATKVIATPSKLVASEYRNHDSIDFGIIVEMKVPGFGFGTRPYKRQTGQIIVKLVNQNGFVIAMIREQYFGPFNRQAEAQKFQGSLTFPVNSNDESGTTR